MTRSGNDKRNWVGKFSLGHDVIAEMRCLKYKKTRLFRENDTLWISNLGFLEYENSVANCSKNIDPFSSVRSVLH